VLSFDKKSLNRPLIQNYRRYLKEFYTHRRGIKTITTMRIQVGINFMRGTHEQMRIRKE
jgi:hypothetical protein